MAFNTDGRKTGQLQNIRNMGKTERERANKGMTVRDEKTQKMLTYHSRETTREILNRANARARARTHTHTHTHTHRTYDITTHASYNKT
jgi:hypothetical protein